MRDDMMLRVEYATVDEWPHVVVNGWDIPGFTARVNAEDECVWLSYGSMMQEVPFRLAPRIVSFIANAITVAQGFGGLPFSTDGELTRVTATQPRRVHMMGGVAAGSEPCRCSPGDECLCDSECECRVKWKHIWFEDADWMNTGEAVDD